MSGKMKKGKTKKVSFTGFIEEIELDDGEKVIQIDDGDDTYLIVMDEIGRQLRDYVDEEIDVTGVISRDADDIELKVNTFRLMDDYDYYYDDRYEEDDEGYSDKDDYYR
jgi:uncharacterized membrane protein YcgQ (UPF0703/DUF1980 family)